MADRNWDSLSAAYRGRLEKGGVSRTDYESGASLSKARGHSTTPERPERAERQPEKYKRYIAYRRSVERQVELKKERLWGSKPGFKRRNSVQSIHQNPVTKAPTSMRRMQQFLSDDWEDLYESMIDDRDDWAFLYYH